MLNSSKLTSQFCS